MSQIDVLVLIAYFLLVVGIGVLCYFRVRAQEDYFMGGRRFGKVLQTFAAFGAGTGSSDPVNVARTTFSDGLSGMWSVMYWLFVTPFYWITSVWYRRMRHLTLGDWYAERYDSRSLGGAYAVFALLFFMVWSSVMFSAIGKVAAPLLGVDTVRVFGQNLGVEMVLVPIIGVAVLLYGLAGGLKAAYWTDLLQGLFILVLSVILIPFGLLALVEHFGDPATQTAMDGFALMHQQVPAEKFQLFGSSNASEFPLYRIVAVVVINLIGVAVHPHFIATGGGAARNETSARVGLVAGNFLKRLCTVGWALTALILLARFADHPELAQDPDRVWGVATREILGPLNAGLVGLMLACLLAALMSSLDTYMLVGSALVVRNLYVAYFHRDADERRCLQVARVAGFVLVAGSVTVALSMNDVFEQLKLTWVVPVVFAAPFWVGILWRRATRGAAWGTVLYSAAAFFVVPWLWPVLQPGLREDPRLLAQTDQVVTTVSRTAAPTDVALRQALIEQWTARERALPPATDPEARASAQAALGERPEPLRVGDVVTETRTTGGKAVFWSEGLVPIDEAGQPRPVSRVAVGPPTRTHDTTTRTVLRYPAGTRFRGAGNFQLDLYVYQWLGMDLTHQSDAMLDTLGLPPRILTPFLVLILLSFVTPRVRREVLDRYYAKMKTPVAATPEQDALDIESSLADPAGLRARKMFPASSFEFERPKRVDLVGFLGSVALCFGIVWLAVFLAGLGA